MNMLTINAFSKLCCLSTRTLRYYDEINLLKPAYIDENRYRYYDLHQLLDIQNIQMLKSIGLKLEEIKSLVKQGLSTALIEDICKKQETKVIHEIALLNNQLKALQHLKSNARDLPHPVMIETLPKRVVVRVRDTILNYHHEGLLWERLNDLMEQLSLKPATPAYALALFHDEDYKDTNVDVEVQLAIMQATCHHPSIIEVEATKVASITFSGDYDQMPSIAHELMQWVALHQMETTGMMFNEYFISPSQTSDRTQWLTKCCVTIK